MLIPLPTLKTSQFLQHTLYELPETEDRMIIMFANKLYGEKPKTDSKYFNDRSYSIWKINL